jgi:F-type H+-transporting ATPase subunit epsilon
MVHLDIITPQKIIYQGDVDEVVVGTIDGEVGILPEHINLFTKLTPGELTVKIGKDIQYLGVTGGFLQVEKNTITILADYAVRAEDVEVEKAVAAQKRAEDVIKNKSELTNQRDFANAQAELLKAMTELRVSNRHKSRYPISQS